MNIQNMAELCDRIAYNCPNLNVTPEYLLIRNPIAIIEALLNRIDEIKEH